MGFQGMTAHWIEVKDGKWKMKAAVIGFKSVSGAHSGDNLGRYTVGLLDRVGIMDKKGSKACRESYREIDCCLSFGMMKLYTATLDNAGNNSTTCETIERIHNNRGLEWNSNELQLPYVNSFLILCTNQLIFY
jgi:hypothetical protein